jgi:hypothetical protein
MGERRRKEMTPEEREHIKALIREVIEDADEDIGLILTERDSSDVLAERLLQLLENEGLQEPHDMLDSFALIGELFPEPLEVVVNIDEQGNAEYSVPAGVQVRVFDLCTQDEGETSLWTSEGCIEKQAMVGDDDD